jgi:signal transduction histidine kinase
MKGITGRLIQSYFLVIFLTVAVLETFLIFAINKYYYTNMENLVSNQIKASADFYSNYFSSVSLEKNIQDNADIFWKNTNAEVQIINKNQEMILNSVGNLREGKIDDSDVEKALQGKEGSSIVKDSTSKEKLLYVSYPLKSSDKVEGVLRFVTSLSEVDQIIKNITAIFIGIGALVILISGMVGILFSNSIVKPIKEVTEMARKMASGRFNERLSIKRKDEIGKLSESFNFMAEEILKNDKLKNEFIASVSHELRTPLTSIKGWAATIKAGDFRDKQEILDGLNIIEKESDRLTLMVEELLDFSRLISGRIALKMDYLDIRNNVKYIEKQFKPRAGRQRLDFKLNIQENLPLIFADENRVNQIIINLLDNSIKFTPEGGYIELTAISRDNFVCIEVVDSGVGIPADELPMVMDKFFKGKSSMSKNGLGLSICREIVELHGGNIKVESEYGKGTKVIVAFPVAV